MPKNAETKSDGASPAICNFAGKFGGCAAGTVANKLVQVGSPASRPVNLAHISCCAFCANKLDTAARNLTDGKREGKNDLVTVPPVLIYNLHKHDLLANAAKNNGAGLVARSDGGKPQCSVTLWDGTPCADPVSGNGVVYDGVIYALCHSCDTCARMVYDRARLANQANASLISPIKLELAKVRAERQLEAIQARQRAEQKRRDAETAAAAPAPSALSTFEEFLYMYVGLPPEEKASGAKRG
jgi:hypothetical protein